MSTLEILNAAKEYRRVNGIAPKEVRLNPVDIIDVVPNYLTTPVDADVISAFELGMKSFAKDNITSMEWFQDATVPVGEIRFAS